MKLSPYQLSRQDHLQAIYHLFGAELLIVEEALNELRALCRTHDYLEREKLTVDAGFDWDSLLSSSRSLSLFATRRVIELRMPSGKPGKQGASALVEYAAAPPPDTVLIVISGELPRAAQQSNWFRKLDQQGASIEAPRVQPQKMPDWIGKRLHHAGIQAEPGVARVISHYVEGNLLAAAQEINFLALHSRGRPLSVAQVQQLISDQARFTSFAFVDACLAGQAARAVRILDSLRGEKVEPILIVAALARETNRLVQLSHARTQGKSIRAMFKRLGIWSSRERLVGSALERVSATGWLRIHASMCELDGMVKGQLSTRARDIWMEIERLGLAMCGQATMLR